MANTLYIKYTIKATFVGKEEEFLVLIDVLNDLEEANKTIDDCIIEACEDKDKEYCCCNINESQTHCECDCGDWNYEYKIVSREFVDNILDDLETFVNEFENDNEIALAIFKKELNNVRILKKLREIQLKHLIK